ncbi:hypothetical protein J5226_15080 [Lysobacter sp. K5869]|uniref:hypothetical protein n=1 Tax=Lysobacter sp. K5869 TaxID=2820808 RepID=UPI001C06284B|nr:hypothetical protein [Lysobacter sp. K5869]QWP74970.1 hypothetical protein J5226_15080 [Lysobacter sp. K5869]
MAALSPPVPQPLQDLLKDYPDLIARIEGALEGAAADPAGAPPFETAKWALEDLLSRFIADARDELDAAETHGDAARIERADDKLNLMFRARSPGVGLRDLSELRAYFEQAKERQA